MIRPHPDLLDELYAKQKKNYPGELPFPERFDLKLDKSCFGESSGYRVSDSRLDYVIRRNLPRVFYAHAHKDWFQTDTHATQILNYNNNINIQFGIRELDLHKGTDLEALDLEYNFNLDTADEKTYDHLSLYQDTSYYLPRFKKSPRVRLRYADRVVNSAGPRWDIYGYIYMPKVQKNVSQ